MGHPDRLRRMSNKPIVVARHDFMNALAETINSAGLPAFVVIEVLERTLSELHKMADKELRDGIRQYMKEQGGDTEHGKETDT